MAELEGVSLWDLDRLQDVAEAYRRKRSLEIPRVKPIIVEEGRLFRAWLAHRAVVPMFRVMRRSFAGIAEQESHEHQHTLAEAEREKLERFTKTLVNKLLHYPTCQLKELAEDEPGHEDRIAAFSDVFASAGWGAGEGHGGGAT